MMKKFIMLFLCLVMLVGIVACGNEPASSDGSSEEDVSDNLNDSSPDISGSGKELTFEGGKTLVVYYSATGNTRNVTKISATMAMTIASQSSSLRIVFSYRQ